MKIAFDVKGTIDGPYQNKVLMLLKLLQDQGHEIIVWSNMYSYATEAVAKHGLNVEAWPKRTKWDVDNDETQYMDVAIDDDSSQTWLAAKRFIWVHELAQLAGGGIHKLANEIGGVETK